MKQQPITLKSDERTREYILNLMETIPQELFQLVKELRDVTEVIKVKADRLDEDIQQTADDLGKLMARLDALEAVVGELCDTASKAVAIGPLWNIMQQDD